MSEARGSDTDRCEERGGVSLESDDKWKWAYNATPFEIMRDEWAREQRLIVGERFDLYCAGIYGYRCALRHNGLRHKDAMDGFEDWVRLFLQDDNVSVIGWNELIMTEHGNTRAAFDRFFELFGLFDAEVAHRGLESILQELRERDMERYGFCVPLFWE